MCLGRYITAFYPGPRRHINPEQVEKEGRKEGESASLSHPTDGRESDFFFKEKKSAKDLYTRA